jgi:Uri superfamily endonuclease
MTQYVIFLRGGDKVDINHTWSGDIALNNYNDISTVSGIDETNQRVLRRLLTNPKEYIWHPDYGAGLGMYIGVALDKEVEQEIKQVITSQMYKENNVAKNPPPDISLTITETLLNCIIIYYDITGTQLTLSFSLQ